MSKHTPGPWLIDGNTVYTLHQLAHVTSNRWSAQVQGYVGCPDDERIANARLIAAVPDLLDELEGTLEVIEDVLISGYLPSDAEKSLTRRAATIRAAIAKATGEK